MHGTTPCPDAARLLRLLDGELPDAEQAELTRHLDGCGRCQRAVEELASGGRSWSDTAVHLGDEPPGAEPEPALRRAVEELTNRDDPNRTQAGSAADDDGDGDLSFLSPSDKPGHLGRLGHYEVLEVVGRGGMGVVLKAFDEKLHRVVAVKALAPQLAVSGTARKRFLREAHAAAAVAHEHVVAIHQVEGDAPVPYLVMQFVAGMSLEERLRQGGPLEVKEVLRIGMQAAAGLAAAHAQGLVHRDVKPGNILLENGVQRVKLTDFGLARTADDASLTQSGAIAGTPLFMSPEQARGEPLDHRSDLFSLGGVLYTLCTGRPPFRAPTPYAVLKRLCEDTPRPPGEINPDVPDWLSDVVMKLLAKDPARRFQTAAEVADLLGQHLAHLQQPHLVPRPQPVASPAGAPRRRGRRELLAAAVVLLAGAAVVGYRLMRDRELTFTAVSSRPDSARQDVAKRPAVDTPQRDPVAAPPADVYAGPAFVLPEGDASMMALDRDGRTLAVPCGDKVVLFDARTGRLLRTLTGHTGRVYCAALSPDGKRAAAGSWSDDDHTVRTWDAETGEPSAVYAGHTGNVNTVAYGPDGKRLVSASSDGTARVWKEGAEGGELVLRGHDGPVYRAAFSPDGGRVVTCGEDRTVRVWDAHTGKEVKRLEGHDQAVSGLAFSPDGRWLASGSEAELKVWDAATFNEVKGEATPAAWLAFAPDGRSLLASAHNCSSDPGAPHVVRRHAVTADGDRHWAPLVLKGKGGWAAYALNPDGRTLFEVGVHTEDRALRAYDTQTGADRTRDGRLER